MKFKQGDRVAGDFYDAAQGQYVRVRGTYYDDGWVKSGASSLEWHCAPNSIRKLKPRAKSVMVTRKMLNGIWEDRVSKDRYTLKLLCRALGLDEARP